MLENLRKLREEFHLSQKRLAEIVGVSQQSINKYENHNVEPDISTLIQLAEYFHTSVDYLVGHTEHRQVIGILRSYELSEDEALLVERYRRLNPKQRQSIDLVLENYRP